MTNDRTLTEKKEQVASGICIQCFWLRFGEPEELPSCDKLHLLLESKIIACTPFLKFAEGLDKLILTMRANGELPEDIFDYT